MRRAVLHEPVARTAMMSRRLGWFAVLVMIFGLALLRWGKIGLTEALAVLAVAPAIALLAVLMALAAFIFIWREGLRGLRQAIIGIVLASLVLAGPAYLLYEGLSERRPHDVSTDPLDPPAFSRSRAVMEARGGVVPAQDVGAVRAAAIPGKGVVEPLDLDVPQADAFNAALKVARNLGWDVLEAVPGGGRVGVGHIDAVDYTPLLRLPVDITIRFKERPNGVRVDVRAVVRHSAENFALAVGAGRVGDFLEELEETAGEGSDG